MTVEEKTFVDSSVWCFYFNPNTPEHPRVVPEVRRIILEGTVAVNTTIVMEVAHYLVRNLTEGDARRKISVFINLKDLSILELDRQTMRTALEKLLTYAKPFGLGGRDATILASMEVKGVKTLMTHDRALKALADNIGFEVIDPLA